jgi:hypothetical protein
MTKTGLVVIVGIILIALVISYRTIPQTFACGICQLVANGAQDVYLVHNDTSNIQSDENKLKSDIVKFKFERKKLGEVDISQSEENKIESTNLQSLVATSSQDVYEFQSDIINLQSDENKLASDMDEIKSNENDFQD